MAKPHYPNSEDIKLAVDRLFDQQVEFLEKLVKFPSLRGQEAAIQDFMAEAMIDLGLNVDKWLIDIEAIKSHRGFSPVSVSYDDAWSVVGQYLPKGKTLGQSLILNGHVDVVPTGPLEAWSSPPFEPRIENGWMYGRGAGDMKAGVSANIFALKALQSLCFMPASPCYVESVIEEECTGNGALSCLVRGYSADAAFIPEPLEPKLMRAQTGPIWIEVEVSGAPGHASGDFGKGASAIHIAMQLIQALDELESKWNAQKSNHPPFDKHPHPINFNIGKINGGEWPSSMPASCTFEVRIAVYPKQSINEICKEFEAFIMDKAAQIMGCQNMPKIRYTGFLAEGYVLENAEAQEAALQRSHRQVWNEELGEHVFAATTDARFTGLYGDCPTLVYGPYCKNPHGFDECVDLQSLRKVTQTMALFIADWCKLEKMID